jgi:hypothetical protein
MLSGAAQAATTGTIQGTIIDAATKKPVVGATVTAVAPSGRSSATTDAAGFYNLFNLSPDTYTVSVTLNGYRPIIVNGVTVVQDQTVHIDQGLAKELKVIGSTGTRSAGNLVQPNQTADVYNVSQQQLGAVTGTGGARTLYDIVQTAPGVTSTGVAGRPRIRGGDVGDVAWELDGIPINDRLTGLFTTNLSVIGMQSLELYTGGYSAQYGDAGGGVINSVVKRGTYPGFGSLTYTTQLTSPEVDVLGEYGGARPDGKLSWYIAFDHVNSYIPFANGYEPFVLSQARTASDNTNSTIYTRDVLTNFHWRPGANDDVQLFLQTGNQKLPFDVGLSGQPVYGLAQCNGAVVAPSATSTHTVTSPGISNSGLPCTVNGVNTGLQYVPLDQQNANVWYHYSNLAKVQWNHVFTDKFFMTLRAAENFNQYIFYQPFDFAIVNGVPTPGAPANYASVTNGTPASGGPGWQDNYSDRRSQMYIGAADFTYTPNAHSTWYGGVSYERDNSAENYYDYSGNDGATFGLYNFSGSYPNLFLSIDYPLILPAIYAGTKQTFGKLTVEPGLRYEAETYDIPNRPDIVNANGTITKTYAYGPYGVHSWEPRFAFSWAPNMRSSIRGSYGVTSSFVPAAYVFNDSPNGTNAQSSRYDSVYYPGGGIVPERNFNADLSYSLGLRNGVDSLRVTPFWRHATNKLEAVKSYTINPVTNLPVFTGPTFFRTGIQNESTGVEFAWNHVLKGDGLSWWLGGTWVNYWGSLTAGALAGGTPYGQISASSSVLAPFLATGEMFRNSSQPPWSLSWTGDYKRGRFHADPFVLYQVGAPYNVVNNNTTCASGHFGPPPSGSTTAPFVCDAYDNQMHFARALWWSALDVGYDVVKTKQHSVTLGLMVRNLFNNPQGDVYPTTFTNYARGGTNPDVGTYGPGQVPNNLYYYAPDSTRRQVQLYLSTKF